MKTSNESLRARSRATAVPCYGDDRLVLVRGRGCHVWDADGNEYLDLLAGIAVAVLGHAHPAMCDALNAQSAVLTHCSNKFVNEPQVRLAEWLCARSFAERVFFTNSGTEAIEAALKLVRRVAFDRGETERTEVVSFEGSFHGRTFGALSATAQPKYHHGFGPLLPGMVYVPFGDAAALQGAINERTAAVILEPIQGEGGIRPFDGAFLRRVRELCLERGALFICDEVQCGMGRTGRLFGFEESGIVPDIVTLAKALGGGVPIGAVLTTGEIGDHLTLGSHGSTCGGGPLMSAVAYAVCETIERERLVERAARIGDYFKGRLQSLCDRYARATEVRGQGLMLGLGLTHGARAMAAQLLRVGVIVNAVGDQTIRLVPPLIIGELEIDLCIDRMAEWLETAPD